MLTLLLAGITMLFLGLSGAYLYSRFQHKVPPLPLPFLFYANILFLLGGSLLMHRSKIAYLNDEKGKLLQQLWGTVGLTVVFVIMQGFAWNTLFQNDIFIGHNQLASYIYLISGLHFVHVLSGLPFLLSFIITAQKNLEEEVSTLIFFSDPDNLLKINMLALYWHFLDGLWIYLCLFFALNHIF